MKTDLLLCTGLAMVFLALPSILHAGEDNGGSHAPLALGQPMEDCAPHSAEAVASNMAPVSMTPAATAPAAAAPAGSTKPAPRHLSTATLLTFALIASPGTGLPQTGGNAGGR